MVRVSGEAARQVCDTGSRTLVTVDCLWRCQLHVWGVGGYLGSFVCLHALLAGLSCWGERESAVSAPYDQPAHFTFSFPPAVRLAGITLVSEGCRATYGNVGHDNHAELSRFRYPRTPLSLCMRVQCPLHDSADSHGPRRGNTPERRRRYRRRSPDQAH